MDTADNPDQQSWWRYLIGILGGIVALLALGLLLIGLIILVAGLVDREKPSQPAVFIDLTSPPPPANNARTRVPQPYDPAPWPDHPGRGAWDRGDGGSGVAGDSAAPAQSGRPAAPAAPVGISVEEYRAAVQSGQRIVLPNPQGECDLSGRASLSADTLENCFARQAAR